MNDLAVSSADKSACKLTGLLQSKQGISASGDHPLTSPLDGHTQSSLRPEWDSEQY
jgi:hypothetical protein